MLNKAIGAAALAVPMFWAAPALAQTAPVGGVVEIFGDDKCPTNESGEEIVVCRRLDEAERFRIPKSLRTTEIAPQKESWAVRSLDMQSVGATGTGSCSTVGPGGQTGCFRQQAAAAKADRRSREKAQEVLPLP